jgi:hypothetical protein
MESIRKAMNKGNLNEDQWEDRKQWSLGVRQRRKNVLKPIYIVITRHRDQLLYLYSVLVNAYWEIKLTAQECVELYSSM